MQRGSRTATRASGSFDRASAPRGFPAGTLLSGAYIGADLGRSPQKQTDFTGLETPPPSPLTSRAAAICCMATRSARSTSARRCSIGICRSAGRRLLARQGRDRRRRAGVREGALRQVRRYQHALVARERRGSAARFERTETQYAIAGDGDRRRPRISVAARPAGGAAGSRQRAVPARIRRSRRDARPRRHAADGRHALRPVAARKPRSARRSICAALRSARSRASASSTTSTRATSA